MKLLPCDRCGIILKRERFARKVLCWECKPIATAIARTKYIEKRRAKNKKPAKILPCEGCGQYLPVKHMCHKIVCETCRPVRARERMNKHQKKNRQGGAAKKEYEYADPLDPYFPVLAIPKISDYPGIESITVSV